MNVDQIAEIFESEGYQWTFADGKRVPNADEIAETISKSIAFLKDSEGATQIEVGRFLIKRSGKYLDVYLHVDEALDP